MRLISQTLLPHLEKNPLRPPIILRIRRIDFPFPVMSETDLRQLLLECHDILLHRNARVQLILQGILLRRQTEGIPPHRMQYAIPFELLEARDDIRRDIPARMPDMQPGPRRIREHIQNIVFLLPRILSVHTRFFPYPLPLLLDDRWPVISLHKRTLYIHIHLILRITRRAGIDLFPCCMFGNMGHQKKIYSYSSHFKKVLWESLSLQLYKGTLPHFPVLHKKKEAYHSLFMTISTDSMKHFPDDIDRLLRRRQRLYEIETGRIQFTDPLERFLIILIAQDDHRNPRQGRVTLKRFQNLDTILHRHLEIEKNDIRMLAPDQSESVFSVQSGDRFKSLAFEFDTVYLLDIRIIIHDADHPFSEYVRHNPDIVYSCVPESPASTSATISTTFCGVVRVFTI